MNTTTSTRPYSLPTELPDPPAAPAGHRGVYRGIAWESANSTVDFIVSGGIRWERFKGPAMGSENLHYIEYIPLRPTPEGVADVPEGFEFYAKAGDAGLPLPPSNNGPLSKDITLLVDGLWDESGWYNAYGYASALRIGSALHHRHFDAAPVAGNPVAVEPECRYFKEEDGHRWRINNATKEWFGLEPQATEWHIIPKKITAQEFINGSELDGTIETDADGNPLVVAVEPQPAKAREWWLFNQPNGSVSAFESCREHLKPVFIHVREILTNESTLLEEAVGWQPIETAPKDGTRILAGSHGCRVSVHYWNSIEKGWMIDYADGLSWEPTHWTPLPHFPEPAPEPAPLPEPDENGWLPIQYAPKDKTRVLAKTSSSIFILEWVRDHETWMDLRGNHYVPTHFQPLPNPPTPTSKQP